MFTGIVEARGAIQGSGDRLEVECAASWADVAPGESMAVNGVCLTVAEVEPRAAGRTILAFDLSPETLGRTSLGGLAPGRPVNLERPVTLLTRMGGHLVQGHVDGVGEVRRVEEAEGGATMAIALPEDLSRYVVEKGSIAVDGVSLTVAGVVDGTFEVALVPYTLAATTLGTLGPGDRVNLEVDVIAKYVERLTRDGR